VGEGTGRGRRRGYVAGKGLSAYSVLETYPEHFKI